MSKQEVERRIKHAAMQAALHAALKELGATPDEVAATLKKLDCRGIICGPHSCPVAKFMMRLWPEYTPVVTGLYFRLRDYNNGGGEDVANVMGFDVEPVRDFVGNFDKGKYPELVENAVNDAETRI